MYTVFLPIYKVPLSPHGFAFHYIIPEHDDERSPDFRQHIVKAELFHEQPHAHLVDPQPHDAGADEQRRLLSGLFAGTCKHEGYTQPVVDNHRNGKGNGCGIQVMYPQSFCTKI